MSVQNIDKLAQSCSQNLGQIGIVLNKIAHRRLGAYRDALEELLSELQALEQGRSRIGMGDRQCTRACTLTDLLMEFEQCRNKLAEVGTGFLSVANDVNAEGLYVGDLADKEVVA